MKKTIFLLLAVIIFMSTAVFAQNQYSYPTSGFVKENNFGDWIVTGYWAGGHKVGTWTDGTWHETRNINNWTWAYNDIPTAATVTSVRMRFRAHDNAPTNFQITIHNLNQAWGSNNYNSFSTTNQLNTADIVTNADGYAYFDVTFASGSALCSAVNSAVQSGQYFLTLGFKITGSYQPNGWWALSDYSGNGYDSNPAIDLQINFSTTQQNYQFVNNIENTENYGSLVLKNNTSGVSNTISSGSTVGLDPKYTFLTRTNELPFIVNWNSSSYTEKQKNWIVNSRDTNILVYNLQPNLNSISAKLTAKFNRTSTTTIQNSLIEGGNTGTINLNDPWYYYSDAQNNWFQPNQFYQYTSPLSIQNNSSDSYGGVYLGLDPSQGAANYYSVRAALTQSITINGQTTTGVFQNWNTSSAQLQQVGSNPSGYDQKAVVFNSSGATVIANYKGVHLSNDANAFNNNSQRRLIETRSNSGTVWMHQVYASAGHIWIEHSSNNGSTWVLGNNGTPLDAGEGKCPSIALSSFTPSGGNTNYFIGVVWQEKNGSYYTIKGITFNQLGGASVPVPGSTTTLFTEPSDTYTGVNANPNIMMAMGYGEGYLITFERKSTSGTLLPGINYLVGHVQQTGTQEEGPFGYYETQGVISGTDARHTNAQLSRDPYYDNTVNQIVGDIIYQTGPNGTIYDKYLNFLYDGSYWSLTNYTTENISYPSANLNPSVVTFANGYYAASWIEVDQVVHYYSATPSVLRYYGTGAMSSTLNRGGSDNGYIAWSRQNGSTWTNHSMMLTSFLPTGNIRTLSTTGKYVQLANSANSSSNNMFVSSFTPFSTPYYFSTSQDLGSLGKTSAASPVTGRGFIINTRKDFTTNSVSRRKIPNGNTGTQNSNKEMQEDGLVFSYRFDDLNVDGKNISFVDLPDTLNYNKVENLNSALMSEPFQLNSNSKVVFTEQSGFADSVVAMKVFGKSGNIHYKVEMIDAATGQVIGTIRDITFDFSRIHTFQLLPYALDTKGIIDRNVKIKITVATSLADAKLVLTKSISDVNETLSLAKSSINKLAMDGLNIPASYEIFQNYPNPFNPTTNISFSLPQRSNVKLVVYDMLGREVTTLANKVYEIGKYEVTFNASNLPSGVYFYSITTTQGTISKKMLLLK